MWDDWADWIKDSYTSKYLGVNKEVDPHSNHTYRARHQQSSRDPLHFQHDALHTVGTPSEWAERGNEQMSK